MVPWKPEGALHSMTPIRRFAHRMMGAARGEHESSWGLCSRMGVVSPPEMEDIAGSGVLSARSVVLGAIMCLVIGTVGPYWTFYLHSSNLFLDYSVAGATFFLFLLVLAFNGLLGQLWHRFALEPGELIVVTAMMLVAGGMTTMGLTGYLIPTITAPYSLADASNNWQELLWPHLPAWASPLDPDGGIQSILLFDQGLRGAQLQQWLPILQRPWTLRGLARSAGNFWHVTAAMPWRAWLTPLAWWGVFLMALYGCLISLMTIVRKQWVDYERLTFPIAQVPQELCVAAAAPWARGSLLRDNVFWFGLAVPFVVGSLTALKKFYPWVPALDVSGKITEIGPVPLYLYFSFAVLGFTFLIPNRVAFSLWFLNLVCFAFRSAVASRGLEMRENLGLYGAAPYPIMAHQGMGAMLVLVGASLYFSRSHLKRVLLCALGDARLLALGLPAGSRRQHLEQEPLAILGGYARQLVNQRAPRRDRQVEDLGERLRPPVDEIGPAVLHVQVPLLALGAGPFEKRQVAAIVEVPGVAADGKPDAVSHGRSRRVLAEASRVDDQRVRPARGDSPVIVPGLGTMPVFARDISRELLVNASDLPQAGKPAVGHDDSAGAVLAVLLLEQVCGDRHGRAAGAEQNGFGSRAPPVVLRQEGLERQAGGDGVQRAPDQPPLSPGDAAHLAHELGVVVKMVKEVAARPQEVQLVRGHQGADGQLITLDL